MSIKNGYAVSGLLALAIVMVLCRSGHAQTERYNRPELSVRITPAKPYVQEEISQTIRLVSAHPFNELDLILSEVDNADAITVVQPSIQPFKSYGVEGFVYETTRVLFARQSGVLNIPAVSIKGVIVDGEEYVAFERQADAVELPIGAIPDVYEGDTWLAARIIEMREVYSKPFHEIRAGETITRTVTVTGKGITGEHIPTLEMRPSRGIKISTNTPTRTSKRTPGGLIGALVQDFDIFVETTQPTDIGPVRLIWWDAEADAGRRSALPAVRIEPLPRNTAALRAELMRQAREQRIGAQIKLAVLLALVLSLCGVVLWIATTSRRLTRHDRHLLTQASRLDNTPQHRQSQVQALMQWARHTFPDVYPANCDALKEQFDDATLHQQLDELQAAAFAHSTATPGTELKFKRLARALIHAAKKNRVSRRRRWTASMNWLFGSPQTLPRLDD